MSVRGSAPSPKTLSSKEDKYKYFPDEPTKKVALKKLENPTMHKKYFEKVGKYDGEKKNVLKKLENPMVKQNDLKKKLENPTVKKKN